LTLSEFIDMARSQGAGEDEIKEYLLNDLENGGRIFGEFRRAIGVTSNGVINRIRDTAQFSRDIDVMVYRWCAVFINTCPDCLERHGEEHSMEEWEKIGLPRAGFTVCRENCKCVLLPANTTFLTPIKRNIRT